MRKAWIPLLVLAAPLAAAWAQGGYTPPPVDAAVASPDRPPTDTARDADRQPAAMLDFAGVKPGMVIADIMPGKGYFTRLFSTATGSAGKVFAVVPAELLRKMADGADAVRAIAAVPAYANVSVVVAPVASMTVPQTVDIAWTSQNYHDVYGFFGPAAAEAMDQAVFAMLRPGGVFVVEDHSALPGASATAPTTLHRIDEETVKVQALEAGFVLAGESDVLHNPQDARTEAVFAPDIRGHTDQFVLKFRKPR